MTGKTLWLQEKKADQYPMSNAAYVIKDYGEGTMHIRWQRTGIEQHITLGLDYQLDQTYNAHTRRN